MKTIHKILLLTALLSTALTTQAQNFRFVDPAATGNGSGTSWANAFTDLQTALSSVGTGTQIWVKQGTYKPGTATNSRFYLPNGVALYGGFDGTETQLNERDWVAHPTILSGDIGTPGLLSDNVWHVVVNHSSVTDSRNRLDGFTVTGGNGAGSSWHNQGGGMYLAGYLKVVNCRIVGNGATGKGAGVSIVATTNAEAEFINCVFEDNHAAIGGAITVETISKLSVTNCTFFNNTSTQNVGQSVYLKGSNGSFYNSIFWSGNGTQHEVHALATGADMDYCIVKGNLPTTLNVSNSSTSDPQFITGTLTFANTSPAFDAGSNAYVNEIFDLSGNQRTVGGSVDIGAYETGTPPNQGNVLRVCPSATGIGDGLSWPIACTDLHESLTAASLMSGNVSIWIKQGNYAPTLNSAGNPTTNPIDAVFKVAANTTLYGGFFGNELLETDRDPALYPVTIDGRLLPGS